MMVSEIFYDKGSDFVNTHLHVGSWIIAFILLFAIVYLYKQNNGRVAKILQMILRLIYIIIIISGVQLLWTFFHGSDLLLVALLKSFVGLWLIGAMEMVTVRTAKSKSTKGFWIQIVISFVITLILGYGVLPW